METSVTIGNAVRRGNAALMTGVSASIRILIAQAQLRPAGDGDERSHRRHHDSRRLPHPSTCRVPKHIQYYIILIDG